ncbi:UNVERIFIED_CONTAM: hypothetical protein FKN15_077324 [Acipenser sinensis]
MAPSQGRHPVSPAKVQSEGRTYTPRDPPLSLKISPSRKLWKEAFSTCRQVGASACGKGSVGVVRPACRRPVEVPPQSELMIWAQAPVGLLGQEYYGLVEPLDGRDTVGVARTLGVVRQGHIPVRVRNLYPFPVYLYRHQRLATVTVVYPLDVQDEKDFTLIEVGPGVVEVRACHADLERPKERFVEVVGVLLQGEKLSMQQQTKVEALLTKWIAAHEDDYGRTGIMQHQITTDEA